MQLPTKTCNRFIPQKLTIEESPTQQSLSAAGGQPISDTQQNGRRFDVESLRAIWRAFLAGTDKVPMQCRRSARSISSEMSPVRTQINTPYHPFIPLIFAKNQQFQPHSGSNQPIRTDQTLQLL